MKSKPAMHHTHHFIPNKQDADSFDQNGFFVCRNLLPDQMINLLEHYLEFQQKSNPHYLIRDKFGIGRYADFLCESILMFLLPVMEKVSGKTLHPTYSYLRIYSRGDDLNKHIDREIAEYSATMTFNYASKELWPIWVEIDEKSIPINLDKGDALIYMGNKIPHWREKFKGDQWAQCFFHYVDANGPFKDYKFNMRSGPGTLPQMSKMNLQDKIQFMKGLF